MSDNDIRSDPIFFIHTWAVPDALGGGGGNNFKIRTDP